MGRRDIDWEPLERAYRIGQTSVVQIATKFGVQRASINRKARKDGWTRDLTDQVRVATKAALILDAKTEAASLLVGKFQESARKDSDAIDAAVGENRRIVTAQRKRIGTLTAQFDALVSQFGVVTSDPELAATLGLHSLMQTAKLATEINSRLIADERVVNPTLVEKLSGKDQSIEALLAAMKADPLSLETDL